VDCVVVRSLGRPRALAAGARPCQDRHGKGNQGTLTMSSESSSPSSLSGSHGTIPSSQLIACVSGPSHGRKRACYAQIVASDLDLALAKQSLCPSDPTFHRVERGITIVAGLVACPTEEVGLGIGPPADGAVAACGDARCGWYGYLCYERQRDPFAGCGVEHGSKARGTRGV